jgi:hypothetical protein
MTPTLTGGRRRTDLGRLDPTCLAAYHGTYTAYRKAGCRCPHAREAHRLYQKRSREGRIEPALIDATGTRRRVQGMWALGHTSSTIAMECHGLFDRRQVPRFCKQQLVTAGHRNAIAIAYQTLIVRPGSSAQTRSRAAAAGYALPVQWGDGIDDPEAIPEPFETGESAGDVIDEVAVERALAGECIDLTDAELVAVLQAGVARGEPLSRLAGRLGVNYAGARTMLGGEMSPRRVQQLRVEAELRARGASHNDHTLAVLLGVHHQTVTRARARLVERGELAAA